MSYFAKENGQGALKSPRISVWLIEDDPDYQRAITHLVLEYESIELSHTFSSCEPAIALLNAQYRPDVILLDIGLTGMSGIEGAKRIKRSAPEVQIIMLTGYDDEINIFEAICAGASGYLLKNVSGARIIEAIREVFQGGVPFTASIARKVLQIFAEGVQAKTEYGLSEREKEVLEHLTKGSTSKKIANILFISPRTVEVHLSRIYAKLHVRNGIEAALVAIREHIV